MVETAISLMLLLTMVFGMLDLAMGVFKQNQLTNAARQIARAAAVRGNLSDKLGAWGPTSLTGNANDGTEVGLLLTKYMVGNDLSEITYSIDWPDGGNDSRASERVQVQLSAPYTPVMTFIFGSATITLQTTSTVPIAH